MNATLFKENSSLIIKSYLHTRKFSMIVNKKKNIEKGKDEPPI